MLKRGAKGREVTELQNALLELGYDLPRFGADGQLGDETLAALELLLEAHGRDYLGNLAEVSDDHLLLVRSLLESARVPAIAPPPPSLVDRRRFASLKHDRGPRPWSSISGICLHQTACNMGESDSRYDGIGAHAVVTRGGKAILVHDFDRLIIHGNRWNAQTIGIEFDGLYAGIEGDPRTVWDDPSTARHETGQTPTPAAIATGLKLIRWMVAEVARRGGKVRALVAHRQASTDRRNDPGSAIWKGVALPLHAELGLSDGGVGFTVGGLPIPEAWDPRCRGIAY